MSKETLQHTMRSKVRVFEDGGIRLLRKGQKGLIHAIFSRFGLVLVLLVLQFGALFSLMRWFSGLLPHYLGGTLLVTAAMMVYLLNQDMNNSVRIPWLVVTALAPVLGVLLFWYTKEDVGHRMLKKRLMELEGQTRSQLPQPKKADKALDADCPGAASLAQYLRGRGGRLPGVRKHAGDLFPQRRSQVCCAAAPAGKRHPVHFSGILHHRRGSDVGAHSGDTGTQGRAGRGCAGDV